ncbi:MAG: redoxin domain-containing protein [Bacteroidota bacterium]|nr:redoxin domain-containing protein [Bacteroidota bacterium]
MQKFFCIVLLALSAGTLAAQNSPDSSLPYKRFPTVPPFKLLETDSASFFTKADLKKNKAVLLMLFSPTCEHCQHETEELLKNMDEFKKIQIVMATTMPFVQMKEFYAKYELEKYKNIKVGQDIQYMLPSFYLVRNLPYLAMYDKDGKLLSTFEGTMKMEDLIKVFK